MGIWNLKTLPISGRSYCCGYWILWVANFRFPVLFVFRISGGIKCWESVEDCNTGCPSSIIIRMEYLLAFQYWYCKLCVENQWGGGKKHCFINFYSLWCLNIRWIRGGERGRKSYLGPAEIWSSSSRSFSHLNQILFKCETPLLFFLIFYYILKQSFADILQNRCPSGLQLY